jgi:hypothetical protein
MLSSIARSSNLYAKRDVSVGPLRWLKNFKQSKDLETACETLLEAQELAAEALGEAWREHRS